MKALIIVSLILLATSVLIIGTHQILKSQHQQQQQTQKSYSNADFYYPNYISESYQDQVKAIKIDQAYSITRWWIPNRTQLDAILTTDKPIYQPNDIVFVNLQLFNSLNKTSIYTQQRLDLKLTIQDAQGVQKHVAYQEDCLVDATSVFTVNLAQIDELKNGGNFKLIIDQNPTSTAFTNRLYFPSTQKSFRISKYVTQTYQITLKLDNYGTRTSYSAGDKVSGYAKIYRSDGTTTTDFSSFKGSVYSSNLKIQESAGPKVSFSNKGQAFFKFTIPNDLDISIATVYLKVTDSNKSGWEQTTSGEITIVLETDQIQMMLEPQSGLVLTSQSIEQTFYFEFYKKKTNNAVDMKNIHIFERCGTNIGYERQKSYILNQEKYIQKGLDKYIMFINTSHRGKGKTMLKIKPDCIIVAKQFKDEVSTSPINPIREWIFKDFIKSDYIFKINYPVIFNASYDDQDDSKKPTKNGGSIDIEIKLADYYVTKLQTDKCEDKQFTVLISNRQHSLFARTFDLQQLDKNSDASQVLRINSSQLKLPTGGILQVTLLKNCASILDQIQRSPKMSPKKGGKIDPNFYFNNQPYTRFSFSASRLIFLKPSNALKVEIQMDSLDHNPGDQKVKLIAKVSDNKNNPIIAGFVSLVVTDQSSIKEYKNFIPSTASRLFLQKDLYFRNTNDQLIQSNQYVEHMWDQDIANQVLIQIYPRPEESNLDLLMGIQPWRRNVFFFRPSYTSTRAQSRKLKFNQLFGSNQFKEQQIYYKNAIPQAAKVTFDDSSESKQTNSPPPSNSQSGKGINQNPQQQLDDSAIKFQTKVRTYMIVNPKNLRSWSHTRRQSWTQSSARVDHTQTVHFSSALMTDEAGKVQVQFDLSDLITKFSVTVQAKSMTYHGVRRSTFNSNKLLQVTFDLPQSITTQDSLIVPVYIQNNSPITRTISIEAQINNLAANIIQSNLSIAKNSQHKLYYTIPSSFKTTGIFDLNIKAKSGSTIFDSLTKKSSIKLKGLSVTHSFGNMIGNQNNLIQFSTINIPSTFVPDTFSLTAKLFPKPVSNLNEAINSLIRDPYGCFEQTSSTNYPLVMAMMYFKTHSMPNDQQQKQREKDAMQKLVNGYNRLIGFQVSQKEGGYQWFGKDPAHQALTAYGLLQFLQMKSLMGQMISSKMIERNQNYLLSKMNSSTGKFTISSRSLDSFGGAPQDLTIAYIVFSLSQAARVNNDTELLYKLKKSYQYILALNTNNDPYMDALIANAMINTKIIYTENQIKVYLDKIKANKVADGSISGASTSITSSRGQNLIVETTSLAVIAWLRFDKEISASNAYSADVQEAIEFLVSSVEKGGSYGSTQATILALKALILYDQSTGLINGEGKLVIKIKKADNSETEISRVTFNQQDIAAIISKSDTTNFINSDGNINIIASIEQFTPKTVGNFKVPVSIQLEYNDTNLQFSGNNKIDLQLQSSKASPINIEDSIEYNLQLKNNDSSNAIGMTLVRFRYPSGLEASINKLQELRKNNEIDFYEVSLSGSDLTTHKEIIFYWRGLQKGETKILNGISFIAKWGGNFKPIKSEAYIFYDKDDSRITRSIPDLEISTSI